MHCDHEKNTKNNELCMIGNLHNSSNRCQDPIKLKAKNRTGKEERTGEVLFPTGNRKGGEKRKEGKRRVKKGEGKEKKEKKGEKKKRRENKGTNGKTRENT